MNDNFRRSSNRPMRGARAGGGRPSGRPGGRAGGPGGRDKKPPLPMLDGEPSPALAKIQAMNIEQLTKKLEQLSTEQELLEKRIGNLKRTDPPDEEKIKRNEDQHARLLVVEVAANKRMAEKLERKAAWEASRGNS